ncbi:MAG: hypothetical protein JWQ98_2469 [Chlorobi bacterium]|nr:hypothetical protein [Chlorobiota bacterium]
MDHIAPTFTRVTLRAASHVHADIMDAAGGTVRVVYDGRMDAGNRTMTIDASSLPAGNYFIRIETGDGIVAKTLVVAH